MAKREFNSDSDIKKLPIEAKRYEAGDASRTGLRVRVSQSGLKTYIWRARSGGKTRIVTIGDYPSMSINAARGKLAVKKIEFKDTELNCKIHKNKKPQTVRQLTEEFMGNATAHLSESRIEQHEIIFRVWVNPIIGSDKLRSLKAPRLKQVIMKAVGQGYHERARQILGVMKRMFRYAEVENYLERSPADAIEASFCGIKKPVSKVTLLKSDEIPVFWNGLDQADNMSDPIRIGIRILMLSGVRSGELKNALWRHVDFDKAVWHIPAENSKTTAWSVPLSEQLLDLFKQLHNLTGDTPFLFAGREKDKPITGKVFYHAMKRLYKQGILDSISEVTPHDFRRSMRTIMAEDLNITDDVAEACLNHAKGGVEGAYNKAQLLNKRRDALQKWGDYVDLLVNPHENVRLLRVLT